MSEDNLSEFVADCRKQIIETPGLKDDERKILLSGLNVVATTVKRIENIDNALTRMANALEQINDTIYQK